jgi:Rps23 Pro-64 3,4-dihydroxylase Tpa1-like proline 4-hydroxylase
MTETLVPMRFADAPLLWVVEDVYSPTECAELVRCIEQWSPRIATNNPIYRDQDRVIRDDPSFAADLFARLRPHLPASIGPLSIVGLNERLRFYRYQAGQQFAPHMDHWYQPDHRHITLLTVLTYFNDDFRGGETRFMEQLERTVTPRPGLVAIFQHKIRHEGRAVTAGRKYAMRTDVMYASPSPIRIDLT